MEKLKKRTKMHGEEARRELQERRCKIEYVKWKEYIRSETDSTCLNFIKKIIKIFQKKKNGLYMYKV